MDKSLDVLPELTGAGVYVLVGPNPEDGPSDQIYIGQAEVVGKRINQHVKEKDFWNKLIAFSNKDANINSAHYRYLESKLIDLSRAAKRAVVLNDKSESAPKLSDPETVDAESFLTDALIIFPLLGLTAFEVIEASTDSVLVASDQYHITAAEGANAAGRVSPGGFIVNKGSVARKVETPSLQDTYKRLRATLLESGVLVDLGANLQLTQDYEFNSPSAAAGVMTGTTLNGRVSWKRTDGKSLADVESELVQSLPSSEPEIAPMEPGQPFEGTGAPVTFK